MSDYYLACALTSKFSLLIIARMCACLCVCVCGSREDGEDWDVREQHGGFRSKKDNCDR